METHTLENVDYDCTQLVIVLVCGAECLCNSRGVKTILIKIMFSHKFEKSEMLKMVKGMYNLLYRFIQKKQIDC